MVGDAPFVCPDGQVAGHLPSGVRLSPPAAFHALRNAGHPAQRIAVVGDSASGAELLVDDADRLAELGATLYDDCTRTHAQ